MVTPRDVQEYARQAAGAQPRADADPLAVHRRLGSLLAAGKQAEANRHELFKWSILFLGTAAAAVLVGIHATLVSTLEQGLLLVVLSLVVLQCSAGLMTMSLFEMRRAKRQQGQFPGEIDDRMMLDAGPLVADMVTGLEGRVGDSMNVGGRVIPLVVMEGRAPRKPEPWLQLRVAAKMRLLEVRDQEIPEYGLLVYDDGVVRVDNSEEMQRRLLHSVTTMREIPGVLASA